MLHDYGWDGGNSIWIAELVNAQTIADMNALYSSTVSPYLYSALKALQVIRDNDGEGYQEECTRDEDDDSVPITSDVSLSSSIEPSSSAETHQDGLQLLGSDLDEDEDSKQLDYVITQADAAKARRNDLLKEEEPLATTMLSTASVPLDGENSSYQEPMIADYEEAQSICSSHDDESVDEFLLRNAQIIEDYFDNNIDHRNNIDRLHQETDQIVNSDVEASQFSWMLVPMDTEEGTMTRVPQTISICKSGRS